MAATGGTAPYTWSVAGGALPGWLSLSPGGLLSGVTMGAFNSNFTLKVQDATGAVATGAYSIRSTMPEAYISLTSLAGGMRGVYYSESLIAMGTLPLHYAVTAGSLPPGLSLTDRPNTYGELSGIPTGRRDVPVPPGADRRPGAAAVRSRSRW